MLMRMVLTNEDERCRRENIFGEEGLKVAMNLFDTHNLYDQIFSVSMGIEH